jgi:type I restriction enzyme S subunit
LRTDAVQNYFKGELRTVAQPTLNIKQIAETKVYCPPLALQESFARHIQAVEALRTTHKAALAESDALFASLQHRAFVGQPL